MERDATLSNGDDALAFSNGGDETLTLISQHSAADDSHKNIGGGGGGRDGEFKALMAELGGLKAKNRELVVELRELAIAAIHLPEIKIERTHANLCAAASAAIKAKALLEELKAKRDKLVGDLASLYGEVDVKEEEIALLQQRARALTEAEAEATAAPATAAPLGAVDLGAASVGFVAGAAAAATAIFLHGRRQR